MLLSVFSSVSAQSLKISGVVKDSASLERLSFTELALASDQKFTVSDVDGNFTLTGLSAGYKLLFVRHVGCEPRNIRLNLTKDTFLKILLSHHDHLFEAHVVYGHHDDEEHFTDHEKTLTGKTLRLVQHQSMGEMLTSINGVQALKTGQAIAKPVIRGLQGNRIIIVDNGLKLESQQWGDEHAPELDSRSAESFKVLKGAGTLRYGYDAIGGIILAEPGALPDSFEVMSGMTALSNGKGGMVFSKMSIPRKNGGWQLNVGMKKVGDQRAPRYILSNTGYEEFTAGVRKVLDHEKFHSESSIRLFYNKPGILKAAHVGNLTDLKNAMNYAEPLVQLPFSYRILRPFQQVMHLTGMQRIEFLSGKFEHALQYGFQINHRKEFDNRRGGDAKTPQLDFLLQTHQLEWHVSKHSGIHFLQSGVQSSYQTNRQKGFLLIPNFRKINNGLYYIHRIELDKFLLEAGVRADLQKLNAYFYTDSGTRSTLKQFSGLSANLSAQYQLNHDWMFYFQLSELWRAPSINEMYSNGLHHGAAALEYGNEQLQKETAWSGAFTTVYNHNKFGFEIEPYVRYIDRFISLQPQLPPALTIRGAFPVFYFETHQVWFKGIDAQWNWAPSSQWVAKGQYSIMQVRTTERQFLNGMPPVIAEQQLKYFVESFKQFKQIQFTAGYRYVFQQKWADVETDYMPPPNGYGLLRLSVSGDLHRKNVHTLSVSADNLLNTDYRDYLSRLRYYANESGINIFINYIIKI